MLQKRTSNNLKLDLVNVDVLTKFDKILPIHSQGNLSGKQLFIELRNPGRTG